MHSLKDLFAALVLPGADPCPSGGYEFPASHVLGADLPQGHLHVWSGPPGAGKTAFLLGLLLAEARRGRHVVLASYDLAAPAVALRLLGMESGVPLHELEAGPLAAAKVGEVARARARLERLSLHLLEARGLTVASLEDRCVRAPARVDVLGVDHTEAIVRPAPQPIAGAFRDLGQLAQQRWLAIVAIARTSPAERWAPEEAPAADRVGWIATELGTGTSAAAVIANRYGSTPSCRMRLEPESGRFVEERGSRADGAGSSPLVT